MRWRRIAPALVACAALLAGIPSPARADTTVLGGPDEVSAMAAEPVTATGAPAGPCAAAAVADAVTGSGATTAVRITGASVTFPINAVPTSWWTDPPVPDLVWQMYFSGLMWFSPVMARNDAAADQALVDVAVAFTRDHPDRGRPTQGWDEGTNLRRQQQLNCLYRRTQDARLVPAIEMAARANLDQQRYYGLPIRPPHNHGLMANLALIDSAELLDRADWRSAATRRLIRDSTAAFTAKGVSIEQSGEYWKGNVQAWTSVVAFLRRDGSAETLAAADRLDRTLSTARSALAHATDPSGGLLVYGDSSPTGGVRIAQPKAMFRDDAAGLLTGRWSWSDPTTTFYALRYGRLRMAHGHEDRGALVWQTAGVPVLTDPGKLTYTPGVWRAHQMGPAAHSTFTVRAARLRLRQPVLLRRQTASGPVHTLQLSDRQYGVAHTRTWSIDHARRRVTVVDRAAAKGTQSFVLDATWRVARISRDRRTVVFRHPGGKRLIMTSTRPITVARGRTSPILGWVFPAYGRRIAAPQALVSTIPGTTRTTLQVTG